MRSLSVHPGPAQLDFHHVPCACEGPNTLYPHPISAGGGGGFGGGLGGLGGLGEGGVGGGTGSLGTGGGTGSAGVGSPFAEGSFMDRITRNIGKGIRGIQRAKPVIPQRTSRAAGGGFRVPAVFPRRNQIEPVNVTAAQPPAIFIQSAPLALIARTSAQLRRGITPSISRAGAARKVRAEGARIEASAAARERAANLRRLRLQTAGLVALPTSKIRKVGSGFLF